MGWWCVPRLSKRMAPAGAEGLGVASCATAVVEKRGIATSASTEKARARSAGAESKGTDWADRLRCIGALHVVEMLAEDGLGFVVAQQTGTPVDDEPGPSATLEAPVIVAHAIDRDAVLILEVDARIAEGDGAVAFDPHHRRTNLVGAAPDHALMALALHHVAHVVASAHETHVGIVDAVGREDGRRAVRVAGIDGETVAHDQAMDRQLVFQRSDAPLQQLNSLL